ncbi:Mitochondrial carrier protein [Cryptosporidium felis]|nr:Mitochondrial carrier protein [Cryptosporidium felis]
MRGNGSRDYRSKGGLRHPLGLTFLNGLAVSLICTPFDVVKNYWIYKNSKDMFVHLISGEGKSRVCARMNTLGVIKELYGHKGLSTFWTGLVPTMMFNIPSNMIFFNTYHYFLNTLGFGPGLAGVQARILTTLFVSPMEFIRTRSQAQIGDELFSRVVGRAGSNSRLGLCPNLFKNYRLSQMWQGLCITIMRDAPFTALYWALTEKLRGKYVLESSRDRPYGRSLMLFSIAALSGTAATLLTHPLDAIKTNIQTHGFNGHILGTKTISSKRIVTTLLHKNGIRDLYTGIIPRILKIIPSCAISLILFEFCRNP